MYSQQYATISLMCTMCFEREKCSQWDAEKFWKIGDTLPDGGGIYKTSLRINPEERLQISIMANPL